MSVYQPDRWCVLEFDNPEVGKFTKVLAGWSGGYTTGDAWKLSSGIESIEILNDVYTMPHSSGSIYQCHRTAYGLSFLTSNVLNNIVSNAEKAGVTVRQLRLDEIYAVPQTGE